MKIIRECCPCCGYPTLQPRDHPRMPTFEICVLCRWQDDGQTDLDADKVYGGANGRYSLTEARANFRKYLLKYSPETDTRLVPGNLPEETNIKEALIRLYEESKKPSNQFISDEIWGEILNLENRLDDITRQKNEHAIRKGDVRGL
ncbi:hypothetical protein SPACI_044580 [Sporomusa acidovorans DSM 3132]|uniref:Cysteine-rich CPCC domain-containing protein n=1 Tax=Sporomusa acidovorans (strain ATCC 49682 / DSM 3132 / Mol) TaxID=1123286 RepID=A0ABZ3J7N4_SPOA4|nr:CPCC family cysteine-rich protein [Sporomusa acidovorans]OZC14095.1 hypothetical protein SPACI_53830 [Sporomusa acidovorans DSM 3132]